MKPNRELRYRPINMCLRPTKMQKQLSGQSTACLVNGVEADKPQKRTST